ncbi:hypothetical protein ACTWQF_31070 [Streptomyces sp. 8N114]
MSCLRRAVPALRHPYDLCVAPGRPLGVARPEQFLHDPYTPGAARLPL